MDIGLSIEILADQILAFATNAQTNKWDTETRHYTAHSIAAGLLESRTTNNIEPRDWFAGLAMSGMIGDSVAAGSDCDIDHAVLAYKIADEMLAERAKSEEKP